MSTAKTKAKRKKKKKQMNYSTDSIADLAAQCLKLIETNPDKLNAADLARAINVSESRLLNVLDKIERAENGLGVLLTLDIQYNTYGIYSK